MRTKKSSDIWRLLPFLTLVLISLFLVGTLPSGAQAQDKTISTVPNFLAPLPAPANNGTLLIVTPYAFYQESLRLATHKRNTGMDTYLMLLEELPKYYPQAKDLPEAVKLAIKDSYQRVDVRYVILMGDVDTFPVRYMWINDLGDYERRYRPTDLYYADLYDEVDNLDINDLDNNAWDPWDYNNDGRYAEMFIPVAMAESWQDLNVDRIDGKPEVAVGRVPASTKDEVATFVDKVISYELSEPNAWMSKVTLVTYGGDNLLPNDPADRMAKTLEQKFYLPTKLYWDQIDPADWKPMLTAAFNEGRGVVAYLGHGTREAWHTWFSGADVMDLNNTGRIPIVFGAACSTAQFNTEPLHYETIDNQEWQCFANDIGKDAALEVMATGAPGQFYLLQAGSIPPVFLGTDEYNQIVYGVYPEAFVRTKPLVSPTAFWRSLESLSAQGSFIRHLSYLGHVTPIVSDLDQQDATFRFVPGLADPQSRQELVSIESWNYPGWFLVEEEGFLALRRLQRCDPDFASRATFIPRDGLGWAADISFESYSKPGNYIRQYNGQLLVAAPDGPEFARDATFISGPPRYDVRPFYYSYQPAYQPPDKSLFIRHKGDVWPALAMEPLTWDDKAAMTFREMSPLFGATVDGYTEPFVLESVFPAQGQQGDKTQRSLGQHYLRKNHNFGFDFLVLTKAEPQNWIDAPEPKPVQFAQFDVESMAEHFLVKYPDRGGIAYIGSYTGTQTIMDMAVLFAEHMPAYEIEAKLGDIWNAVLIDYLEDNQDLPWGHWMAGAVYQHIHKVMLFGDPSLRVNGVSLRTK